MANRYIGRYCTWFYCATVGDKRCCVDCWRNRTGRCDDPCLNDPERCRLEDVDRLREEGAKI